MKKKNILNQLLEEISPIEQAQTDAKMEIAVKIADAMEKKGWKPKDLLAALNKDTPSIVTKWLSGTHNFTVDTLIELEAVLQISLLNHQLQVKEEVSKFNIELQEKKEIGVCMYLKYSSSNNKLYSSRTSTSSKDKSTCYA